MADLQLKIDTSLGSTLVNDIEFVSGNVNVTVDWGDGDSDTYTSTGSISHSYSGGTYTITISGTHDGEFLCTDDTLTEIIDFGDLGTTHFNFRGSSNLTAVPATLPSSVTSCYRMFNACNSLTTDSNFNLWDTSNVTDMSWMFYNATSFNADISNWDTTNVTDMSLMFRGTDAFNQDISHWNVSNVTSMGTMFYQATAFNQDLSSWCVEQISSEPSLFDDGATSWTEPKPNWGDPCPTPTPTPTPSGVAASPTPTPTSTPTPTPSISDSATATPTPTPSISDSATATPTPTPTNAVSDTPTPTPTPSISESASNTPTPTPSISQSATNTPTPTPSISQSNTATPTPTPSISESNTATPTPTPTPTPSPSAVDSQDMVFVYDTSLGGLTVDMFFGADTGEDVLANIDWGDGNSENAFGENVIYSHTYSSGGIYTIVISDAVGSRNIPEFGRNAVDTGAAGFTRVLSFGNFSTRSFIFDGWENLVSVPTSLPSSVTSMNWMFRYCENFNSSNITGWNTYNVTTMRGTFEGFSDDTSTFNQDISGWDTRNVTDMRAMFKHADDFNQDLSSWCVENISSEPTDFDFGADSWTEPRPQWGVLCASPTPTPTPSISESATQTPTPTPTPSISESATNTPTPTPSISDSATATPTPTPSISDSATATPTPTPSISESNTPTPTPSISDSATATPTPTPSISESATNTPTPTPSISDSATPTPTPSISESNTPTPTPSISESATQTPTPTPSISDSATQTPTPTPSISDSATATPTPTPSISESNTPTPTPSISQSNTPTPTPTPTPSFVDSTSFILEFDNSIENFAQFNMDGTTNVTVDWGDGNSDTYTSPGIASHSYSSSGGPYNITITGTLDQFNMDGVSLASRSGFTRVASFGNLGTLRYEFELCENLVSVSPALPSSVTSTSGMFKDCTSFNDSDVGLWNMSNVQVTTNMFEGATAFNQPIGNWDVSNVDNMANMFLNASIFNQDISGWNVGNVQSFSGTFSGASAFNSNLDDWDVSSATSMSNMFFDADNFDRDIRNWDTTNVQTMSNMFNGAGNFNQDISYWNVSNVTNMDKMFYFATSFNRDLSDWCVEQIASEPTDFDTGASSWTAPKPNWGASCVTPTPTPTGTSTPTPTPTPSVSESNTPTPTPTPTPSISQSATATPTPTPSISESNTPTPTPSISQSNTPTPTPSISDSATPTPTPSISESATQTPTPTPSISESATQTPTPTPSISESSTPTPTPSISDSATATPTPTPSISDSATPTPTPTSTPTPTPSAIPFYDAVDEALFSNGEEGAYYVFSDRSTLFQNESGTIAVTLDGDKIARANDLTGNGNHATQPFSTRRPTAVSDLGVDSALSDEADYGDYLEVNIALEEFDVINVVETATDTYWTISHIKNHDGCGIRIPTTWSTRFIIHQNITLDMISDLETAFGKQAEGSIELFYGDSSNLVSGIRYSNSSNNVIHEFIDSNNNKDLWTVSAGETSSQNYDPIANGLTLPVLMVVDQSVYNDTSITELWRSGFNNHFGTFPDLSGLTGLQYLRIANADVYTGGIPDLDSNTALTDIMLDSNDLCGSFPDFTNNTLLETIRLAGNDFDGPIPSNWENLANLSEVNVSGNNINGPLPNFNNYSSLTSFNAIDANVIGNIPVSTFTSTTLVTVRLDNNPAMTGDILELPSQMEVFTASNTALSGTLPDMDGATSLRYFSGFGLGLTGTLPDMSNTQIQILQLSNNNLTGVVGGNLNSGFLIEFYNNALDETSVDAILVALDNNGINGGYVSLHGGSNAPPSATGDAAKTSLESKGWTVIVNETGVTPTPTPTQSEGASPTPTPTVTPTISQSPTPTPTGTVTPTPSQTLGVTPQPTPTPTVTPSQTPPPSPYASEDTIEGQLNKFSINNIVELFEVDLSTIGGSDILRFSAHICEPTLWRGDIYLPLPLEISDSNRTMEGAPPRMNFRVSNINRALMSEVLTLGDMVGAEVTRWRTLARFLDDEPTADPTQHWPIERYVVIQMSELSRDTISFTIGTEIDRPTRKIPRRQVLREDVDGALYAPLAGLYGLNRR